MSVDHLTAFAAGVVAVLVLGSGTAMRGHRRRLQAWSCQLGRAAQRCSPAGNSRRAGALVEGRGPPLRVTRTAKASNLNA